MSEIPQRLSGSPLWALQRSYFHEMGTTAWEGDVPWFVTSNAFIARSYARIIHALGRDLAARGDDRPITVLELGAGHGRLGFLVLEQLHQLAKVAGSSSPPIRYLMTDFTTANVASWAKHPCLSRWMAAGTLTGALFDVEQDGLPRHPQSGAVIPIEGPLVVLANYVFDGLIMDAWKVKGGRLLEGRVHLLDKAGLPLGDAPEAPAGLKLLYDFSAEPPRPIYDDPLLNRLVDEYQRTLADTTFTLPLGALKGLAALAGATSGPLLLLAADKGYTRLAELLDLSPPQPVAHGSVSFSVNFHAIQQWVLAQGGRAVLPAERAGGLQTIAYLLHADFDNLPSCRAALRTELEDYAPPDFITLRKSLLALESPPPDVILNLMALSAGDTATFLRLMPTLKTLTAKSIDKEQMRILLRCLGQISAHAFPYEGEQDVPFQVGLLLYGLGQHRPAIPHFHRSLDLYGDHPVTRYDLALCHAALEEVDKALVEVEHSLAMRPDSDNARRLKLELLDRRDHQ